MCQKDEFSDEVYPLVKSLFPGPGSVVLLGLATETVYGVVGTGAIEFFDEGGHAVAASVYDQECHTLDLTKGGDTHPSVLYNFSVNYLGMDGDHFVSFLQAEAPPLERSLPPVVEGGPSYGYEAFPAGYDENVKKSVVVGEDHTFRVVLDTD